MTPSKEAIKPVSVTKNFGVLPGLFPHRYSVNTVHGFLCGKILSACCPSTLKLPRQCPNNKGFHGKCGGIVESVGQNVIFQEKTLIYQKERHTTHVPRNVLGFPFAFSIERTPLQGYRPTYGFQFECQEYDRKAR